MATTYKRLAAVQSNGTIGTAANIYTATGQTLISTITVCNTASVAATFTLGISTASATYQSAGYITYVASIQANDTVALTFGITMDATNKYLVGSSSNSGVSFSVFGAEIT